MNTRGQPKPDALYIIAEILCIPQDQITPEARLEDDLGGDSLDIAEIFAYLEDTTGWEFTRQEISSVQSVKDIQATIDKRWEADNEPV